jgi:hypothetical protein
MGESRGLGKNTDLAVLPGSECFVGRNGGCVFLFCREETTLDEPADCVLRGALAEADVFGELLIADLNVPAALLGFSCEPKINKKASRAAIVSAEVAQKGVDYVGVKL